MRNLNGCLKILFYKNFFYFAKKKKLFFFLFYTTFTKHLHGFIYSTNLFNKIFILLHFYYYFLQPTISLSSYLFSFNPYPLALPICRISILQLQRLNLFLKKKKKNRSPTTISYHHPRHFHKCKSKKDDQFTTQHHTNNPENSKKKKKIHRNPINPENCSNP